MIAFSNKKFWPLFWTQFLGALNDNVLKNAMVIMITYKGLSVAGLDSPSIVALSGGIFILPFFLFSLVAGQIADKHEKSQLVRFVKVWELMITMISSAGFYFHNVGLLLGALFMMGMHSTFFGPIKYSAIPDLVEPENLVSANAYVEVGTVLAILLGTIGGGAVIALPHGEIFTSLTINFLALLGLLSSLRIVKLPSVATHLKINISPITPVLETIRLLRFKPEMFSAIMAISWFWFFGAAVLSILPPYCKDFLRVDEHVITSFLAMYTLGIGLGSLLCERLSFQKTELGLVPLGAVGLTVFLFDICMVRPELLPAHEGLMPLGEFLFTAYGVRLLIDFLMMSVSGGIFILPLYTLLQERSDKEFRSRVIAGNNVFNAIFMVVSALLVMALHLLGYTQPQTLMFLVAGNVLFCSFIFWHVPEFIVRLRLWIQARLA
ncbi:MAG: MFS transporter [Bdellovibrionales bacterium]